MHRFRFQFAALFVMAINSGAASSAETWRQYTFEADGYIVEFPGEPSIRTGSYTSRLVANAPTTYSYFEDQDNIYSAAVMQGVRAEDSAAILNEADYLLAHLGDTVLNTTSRPGQGHYGRYISLDCRAGIVDEFGGTRLTEQAVQLFEDAAGVNCEEGARLTAVLVYRKEAGGRLYIIMGINRPEASARTRANAARFAFSLVWAGANASIVDIVQQYDVSPEEAREILERLSH